MVIAALDTESQKILDEHGMDWELLNERTVKVGKYGSRVVYTMRSLKTGLLWELNSDSFKIIGVVANGKF